MKKILVVIDMQNDFISGSLGSKEAQNIVPNVVEKIKNHTKEEPIFYTLDSHDQNYLNTQEGKNLPIVHCLKLERGWKLDENIREASRKRERNISIFVHKEQFGTLDLIDKIRVYYRNIGNGSDFQIELVGLVLDICVISNAIILKTAFPEAKIVVDLNCVAATSKEAFEAAEVIMKSCHIEMIGG